MSSLAKNNNTSSLTLMFIATLVAFLPLPILELYVILFNFVDSSVTTIGLVISLIGYVLIGIAAVRMQKIGLAPKLANMLMIAAAVCFVVTCAACMPKIRLTVEIPYTSYYGGFSDIYSINKIVTFLALVYAAMQAIFMNVAVKIAKPHKAATMFIIAYSLIILGALFAAIIAMNDTRTIDLSYPIYDMRRSDDELLILAILLFVGAVLLAVAWKRLMSIAKKAGDNASTTAETSVAVNKPHSDDTAEVGSSAERHEAPSVSMLSEEQLMVIATSVDGSFSQEAIGEAALELYHRHSPMFFNMLESLDDEQLREGCFSPDWYEGYALAAREILVKRSRR